MAVTLPGDDTPMVSRATVAPGAAQDGVTGELLLPSLRRAARLALLFAYIWFLSALVGGDREADWWQPAPSAVLALLAAVSVLISRRYTLALAALLAGLVASALIEAAYGAGQAAPWLALAAALGAGLLAAPPWLLALVVLGGAASPLLAPWPLAWPLIRNGACGLALSWAVGGNLHRVLSVATRREAHAWHQTQEAQRRRGELQRTGKALHDMYALLERTNRELEIARREAEEARSIKARFAASISHELRTPLNLIMGFSRIMHRTSTGT